MKVALLPVFFTLALVSTGEATLKVYPFFFGVFVFVSLLVGLRPKKILLFPVVAFVFASSLFAILNIDASFDTGSMVKLVLNFVFFLFAGSFVLSLPVERSICLFRVSACVFLFFSFLQALFIVYDNSLWMLPFSLEDSGSSYVIQQGSVFFGDLSKNIWASKVSIFLMVLCCCQYMERRGGVWFWLFFLLGAFGLIYVSSRTAQMAFLMFVVVLFYYHFWIIKRQRAVLVVLGFCSLPVFVYFFQVIFRLDYELLSDFDLTIGSHMGDGFLARLIIWSHIFHSTDFSDYLFGNGVLSFAYYTGGRFSENNPHNVFLSVILDFGVVVFLLYILLLGRIFGGGLFSFLMVFPFMVFANSQYLGYDSDLIVFFLLVLLVRFEVDRLSSDNVNGAAFVSRIKQ